MVTSVLPAPLQLFAQIIKHDGARQLGSAVIFASVPGFDLVEQRINDIAVVSGVSSVRLQQIIDTGRQAFDPAAPKRSGQHVVSQSLLKFFYGPTTQGDRLLSYDLRYGSAKLRSAASVGRIKDFVKIDSEETENLWGRTERYLPDAIRAARTRRIFRHPEHVAVIKDAIALHFARSLDVLDSADLNWQQTLARARTAYLADRGALEELFYRKHGYYAGGPTVHEQVAADLLCIPKALYESGAAFRLRVVDVFEEARRMAAAAGLEIIWPKSGHFLIGDVPAVSIDSARRALGIRGGVPFGDATSVILPLGPTRLAALGREDRFEAVPAAAVRFTNSLQIEMAHKYVFMRPGTRLESFVAAQRPPVGSAGL